MKNSIKIYTVIALLFLAQACGSNVEKNNEDASMYGDGQSGDVSAMESRMMTHKKDSTTISQNRMKAMNDLIAKSLTYTDTKGTIIYHKAEVNPSFVGGNKAMLKYLNGAIVYPEQAEKDELEGTVFVDFVIGLDGMVSNVEVKDATSEDVDQAFRTEAARVVSSMPNWIPGTQNKVPVNVKYSIPISFHII